MSFQILLAVYFIALALEIFAILAGIPALQYFSKPSLMLILLVYYARQTRKLDAVRYLIVAALFFSWIGDVVLLVDREFKTLFVYGLAAFLVAHLFYIAYFWRIRRVNRIAGLPNPLIFAAIAAYSLALFGFLAPSVKNLLVPVGLYALVISTMIGTSLAAFDFGRQNFGRLCVAGSFLFVASDSILAINRFAAPFEYAPGFIMTTYALAQLFITEGSLRNLKNISHRRARSSLRFIKNSR